MNPSHARRASIRLSYANAGLWSLGNGLSSTTLVIYLARELGAPQLALGVALLRAAPQLIGLLRLGGPALIDRLGGAKRLCVTAYRLSAVVLFALPWIAAPGRLPSAALSLTALVVLWSGYHLLEYLATIALWSWLADLAPPRVRGRFIGRRNLWLLWGGIIGMFAGVGITELWRKFSPHGAAWIGYALAAACGAVILQAATWPLSRMVVIARGQRRATETAPHTPQPVWQVLRRPLADWRFRRFILIGCWLSAVNGLTQSAQSLYPLAVLGLLLLNMHTYTALMELGQSAISPMVGKLIDRVGNRPVMVASQLVVAQGPMFFLLATPAHPGWIAGAYVVWIAYAGLNIALPTLMLKLSPADDRPAYVATYFAFTGLAFAVCTIGGGAMQTVWEHFGRGTMPWNSAWTFSESALFAGWIGRMLGAVLLLLLVETRPGQRT